jgi:hypothetical protein
LVKVGTGVRGGFEQSGEALKISACPDPGVLLYVLQAYRV